MQPGNLITKANALNEARYKLSSVEQKIVLSVVSMVQKDDEDFKTYQMKIADFLALTGRENGYTEIKAITKNLMEKPLSILTGKSELQIAWFSSVEYFNGKGYVEFSFDPKLKPYLLHLKSCFISYPLSNIMKLSGSYSIRIYELLKQYERIGKRVFTLDKLKSLLGIEKTEYKLYGHFKSRVLIPSQNELSDKTDINFDFREIKTGRKITDLEFNIFSDSKKKVKAQKEQGQCEQLISALINIFAFSDYKAKQLCSKYASSYLEQNMQIVQKQMEKSEIENPKAYLLKALREDFTIKKAKAVQNESIIIAKHANTAKELALKELFKADLPLSFEEELIALLKEGHSALSAVEQIKSQLL